MSRSIGILCAVLALSAGLTATPAGAQEPTEEIIVRGFRGSLGRALEVKRSETGLSTASWPRTSPTSPI